MSGPNLLDGKQAKYGSKLEWAGGGGLFTILHLGCFLGISQTPGLWSASFRTQLKCHFLRGALPAHSDLGIAALPGLPSICMVGPFTGLQGLFDYCRGVTWGA